MKLGVLRFAEVNLTMPLEHIEENDCLLTYVFLARVTDNFIDKINTQQMQYVKDFLQFMEEKFSTGNDEIRSLISLGVLENLIGEKYLISDVFNLLGKNLKSEFLTLTNSTRNL